MAEWEEPVIPTQPVTEVNAAGLQQDRHEVAVIVTEKDNDRMRQGTACFECLAPFPAVPNAQNVDRFKPFDMWGEDTTLIRQRIVLGGCPICACPINPEVYSKMLWTP